MKIHELININRELLQRLCSAGVCLGDYQYTELFTDYTKAKQKGEKVTYIVATLSEKYGISERSVYSIIQRFNKDILL